MSKACMASQAWRCSAGATLAHGLAHSVATSVKTAELLHNSHMARAGPGSRVCFLGKSARQTMQHCHMHEECINTS